MFCGLGAGAKGFLDARANLGRDTAEFVCMGGVDNDPDACRDFEYLTGSKATCADVSKMQPVELRRAWGDLAPDCVFLSAPCKGFSGLLSSKQAASPKYQALNRLVLEGMFLLCETWARPPGLLVFENVPLIRTRGKDLLLKVKTLLQTYGYEFHEATHECGELGGLGQIRRRYLLVARLPEAVPAYVYRPPKQRVKACGEILGTLPLPGDPAAGELHALPRISWLNWLRLALIPAGGDWRDLPGMRPAPERRAGAMGVLDWDDPARAVTGSMAVAGSNTPAAVGDPRIPLSTGPGAHTNIMAVTPWEGPTRTVTGAARPGAGSLSVADPRLPVAARDNRFSNQYRMRDWVEPAGTVTGDTDVQEGAQSVADPRGSDLAAAVAMTTGKAWGKENKPQLMGVGRWDEPSNTITGKASISGGNARAAVADPREPFRGTYGVIDWRAPAPTIRGAQRPSQGAVAIADPRLGCEPRAGVYGVLSWEQAAHAVTGNARIDNGSFAVSDPRGPSLPPELKITDPKKDKPDFIPVIIAEDGTWHRPLTTLELAALQGLPPRVNGEPLKLAGTTAPSDRNP